jgi:biopolymer transport protein ExbD
MITRPLDLQSQLSAAPRDLDFFAWVNVGVIMLFFGLLGSRFVLAPGLPIDVASGTELVLPQVGTAINSAAPASVVVSYRRGGLDPREDVILFEGGKYTLPELQKHMESYAKQHPGAVMLVRADRQVSMQAVLNLCEMARRVGFANVLLAAEQPAVAPANN